MRTGSDMHGHHLYAGRDRLVPCQRPAQRLPGSFQAVLRRDELAHLRGLRLQPQQVLLQHLGLRIHRAVAACRHMQAWVRTEMSMAAWLATYKRAA